MPLRLEVKKELSARSDRVKCVDIYSADHPWVLSSLYNGHAYIWDYSTSTLVKSFEVCEVPVRCAKFITRKQWIVTGSDDMHMRVYNYNTMEKVREWEAHTDYIRFIEVHPNRPLLLSSSDDMSIKLWDWERDFSLVQVYEGHAHYVMMVKFNPRDTNTFASASLDRTIKVWGVTAGTPHFSLEGTNGHERGVNCIDYYPGGDKPYLLSGSDDRTIKVWDYQTKACLQTLKGHSHNISSVVFHPRLPLVISASEDGTVRLWHSTTYRPETTLNYGMERSWTLAVTKDANKLAVGYDEGTVVLKLGKEKPVASMDTNTGKIVWATAHDVQTMSVKGVAKDVEDGERLPLQPRDLGSCEVYPQQLQHNCNGQFVCICGDGEFIIYTAQALRNKAFGSALDFVWSAYGTGDYAIRESISRVRTFKNFKDHKQIALPIAAAEGIFGGACLGVKGPDCVVFYDWEEGEFIRKIDVVPHSIYWNESGDALVIAAADTYYVLHYNKEVVATALSSGQSFPDGIEGSFELECTINDSVRTGQWIGECFLYTNGDGKLNYTVGGEVMTLHHLDHRMYLLGFVPKEDRVYLIDKAYVVSSRKLLLSVLNYQTAVVRKDFTTANALLPTIPRSEYAAVAKFLESQGFKEEAMAVTTDNDHRFELAIDLKHVDIGLQILIDDDNAANTKYGTAASGSSVAAGARGVPAEDSTEVQSKWRRLGDLALGLGDIEVAQRCILRSGDLSGLLLLYSSSGNKSGMRDLARQARDVGRCNVAFVAYFVSGQVEDCIDLLVEYQRIPEAAFMARTYMPSRVSDVLALWKEDLHTINERAADALADPAQYPNLFPDLEWAMQVEGIFKARRSETVLASNYVSARAELDLDLIALVKNAAVGDEEAALAAAAAAGAAEADAEGRGAATGVDEEVLGASPTASPPASPQAGAVAADSPPKAPTPAGSAQASPTRPPVPPAATSPVAADAPEPQVEVEAEAEAAAPGGKGDEEGDDLDDLLATADDLMIDEDGDGAGVDVAVAEEDVGAAELEDEDEEDW